MEEELAKISRLSFDNIYGNREISNISTYCKSKTCWERLQAMNYELPNKILECLVSDEDRSIDMIRAKKEQRSDSNISFAIQIYKLGETYWQNLIDKATKQNACNSHDIELLEFAKKSCRSAKMVSNKQAAVIEKIVEELKKVGIQ